MLGDRIRSHSNAFFFLYNIRVNFFPLKLKRLTLWQLFLIRNWVSPFILNRRMIVWSGWDSSICQNYWKKILDCRSFSVLKILTGYRPCSRSLYYFPSKFPSFLRGNHTRSIRALSPKFMYHIHPKLNTTALQNCLNWHLIRDMFGQDNVVFSLSFLKPIL